MTRNTVFIAILLGILSGLSIARALSQPQSIDYFGVAILVYNYHLLNSALIIFFNGLPLALMLVIVAGFTGLYKIGRAIGYVIGFFVGGLGVFQVFLFPPLIFVCFSYSDSQASRCLWIAAFFASLGALGMGFLISRIPILIDDLTETPGRLHNPHAMLSVIMVAAVITLMIWGVTQPTQQRQNQMVVQTQLAVIATQDALKVATQDAIGTKQTPGITPDARAAAAQTQVPLDRATLAAEASNLRRIADGSAQELEPDITLIFLLCCAGVLAVPVGILLILNGLVSLQSRL